MNGVLFLKGVFCLLILWAVVLLIWRIKKGRDLLPQGGIDVARITDKELVVSFFVLLFLSLLVLAAPQQVSAQVSPAPKPIALIVAQLLFVVPALALCIRKYKLGSALPWDLRLSGLSWGHFLLLSLSTCGLFLLLSGLYTYSPLREWTLDFFQGKEQQDMVTHLAQGGMDLKITIAVCAVIFAPLVEEVIFRGYLYPVFKKFLGWESSLVFTSILFGLLHVDIVAFLPLSIFGALLAIVYERTKTLWAPILAHFLMNLLTIVIQLFYFP